MLLAVPAIMLIAASKDAAFEIRHLCLSDLCNLVFADGRNLCLVRNTGTRLDIAGLLQQNCCRRSLCNKAEASICINGDNYRDDHITLVSRSCVELLGELYNINTVLTQCRTNRRSRGSSYLPESVI